MRNDYIKVSPAWKREGYGEGLQRPWVDADTEDPLFLLFPFQILGNQMGQCQVQMNVKHSFFTIFWMPVSLHGLKQKVLDTKEIPEISHGVRAWPNFLSHPCAPNSAIGSSWDVARLTISLINSSWFYILFWLIHYCTILLHKNKGSFRPSQSFHLAAHFPLQNTLKNWHDYNWIFFHKRTSHIV